MLPFVPVQRQSRQGGEWRELAYLLGCCRAAMDDHLGAIAAFLPATEDPQLRALCCMPLAFSAVSAGQPESALRAMQVGRLWSTNSWHL